MTDRKPRVDGAAEAQRIAAGANKHIKAPIALSVLAQRFFDEIIDERPKADWTPHDISMAAVLAMTMGDICSDPEQSGLTQKINATISIRRSLGLHAPAMADAREHAKRNRIGKQIENDVIKGSDDDLIASPSTWN